MKTFLLLLLLLIMVAGAFSQSVANRQVALTTISTDKKYGRQPRAKSAIKVGSVQNEYVFIRALAGPNGEDIQANRLGSCCSFSTSNTAFGKGLLDRWEVSWAGATKPMILYLNPYDWDTPQCPLGLTIVPQDSLLTGWYGIADQPTRILRIPQGRTSSMYIDREPLLTIKDFVQIEFRDSAGHQPAMLVFTLKKTSHEKWYKATTRYTRSQVGFILKNRLIQVLTVQEPVYGGVIAVHGQMPKEGLLALKQEIEEEMEE